MNKFRWETLGISQPLPGVSGKKIVGERFMMCWFQYEPNVTEPVHQHESEQLSYVVKGQVEFLSGRGHVEAGPGDVFYFPSNDPHGLRVLSKGAELIEIFSPIRPDLVAAMSN